MGPRAATVFFAIWVTFGVAGIAVAQSAIVPPFPRANAAGGISGKVVDAEGATPLAGAIVVARWEWETWIPPRFHGGGYYQYAGDAVHVAEALSDASGRYSIPRWGPKIRANGRLAEGAPRMLFFKPGYEPLVMESGKLADAPAKLKRFGGSPREYAALVARFQSVEYRGLAWSFPDAGLDDAPRMVLAIHREKARLGEDGAAIAGANLLPGRNGKGELVDAQTGKAVEYATLSITWTLRRVDGAGATRRVVEQKRSGADSSGSVFYVSPWRPSRLDFPGWEIATDVPPRVRVYALGYARSEDVEWPLAGGTIRLSPNPGTPAAALAQLREWRRDIDAAVAAADDRETGRSGQWLLAWRLAEQCVNLTPDLHAGLCHEPRSEMALVVAKARTRGYDITETFQGPRTLHIVAADGPGRAASAVQAHAVAAGPGNRLREPVRGFSIEPVP